MASARVPILMYHTLGERPSIISIAPSVFEWQMRWLHEKRYKIVSLSQLAKQLRTGVLPNGPTAVITFDDGFSTVYTVAFPVLARYRFPATVFVIPSLCGKSNEWPDQPTSVPRQPLLTWAQIRGMHRDGIEFGGHTLTHRRLDRLPPAELQGEILDSKAMIEDRLGDRVEVFAYPFGKYNDAVKAVVASAYVGACTTHLSLVDSMSDPLALSRVEAHYVVLRPVFASLSSQLFPRYLDVRRALRTTSSIILKQPWK